MSLFWLLLLCFLPHFILHLYTTGCCTEMPTPPLICTLLLQKTSVYQINSSENGHLRVAHLRRWYQLGGFTKQAESQEGLRAGTQSGRGCSKHRWGTGGISEWQKRGRQETTEKGNSSCILECKEENRDYNMGKSESCTELNLIQLI